MRSKRKNPRLAAQRKADAAFSLYIRERDHWTCICCGWTADKDDSKQRQQMHCGHLVRRGKQAVRYDEDNAHAQCFRCNKNHQHNHEVMTLRVIQKIGKKRHENLLIRAGQLKQWKAEELLTMASEYLSDHADLTTERMGAA